MRFLEALPYIYYTVVLEPAHDGDTVRLDIDLGFDSHIYKSIRLEDINAAELNDKDPVKKQEAIEARDYLRKLLPVGSTAVLHTKRYAKSFERYVGHIFLSDGRDVGQLMLEAGHAVRVLIEK